MTIRVLGLGNDLLADDAFGVEVVRDLGEALPGAVETRLSIASGFALLDDVLECDHLVVIDTIATGGAAAGTVHRFALSAARLKPRPTEETECGTAVSLVGEPVPVGQGFSLAGVNDPAPGSSPHYVGLFETLRLGRALGLRVPGEVVILAVEAGDCLTIGGAMCAEVRAAKPVVRGMVEKVLRDWSEGPTVVPKVRGREGPKAAGSTI